MSLSHISILITILFTVLVYVWHTDTSDQKSPQPPISEPIKQESPPILQIDHGGHKALIRDIVFTPDGRYLVSAGEDKRIRVWNLKTERIP